MSMWLEIRPEVLAVGVYRSQDGEPTHPIRGPVGGRSMFTVGRLPFRSTTAWMPPGWLAMEPAGCQAHRGGIVRPWPRRST